MEVRLDPPAWATHLLSDLDDWHRRPRPRDEIVPFELPDDAWFEYAWRDAEGRPRPDPDGVSAHNPWWDYACRIAGPLWAPHPEVPVPGARAAGRLRRRRLRSAAFGDDRWVFHYSPAGGSGPRPLVVIQDGKAAWHHGRFGPLVDDLTVRGAIPPAHYVFVQPQDRGKDYVFNRALLRFTADELLPRIEDDLPCDGRRVVWGMSLGALASAWLALEGPGLFDTVVAQSGAFLGGPGDHPPDPYRGSEWLLGEVLAGRADGVRWSLECGTLEWLHDAHTRLVEAMTMAGCVPRAVTRPIGHNWTNWRQGAPDALRWALSG